MPPLPEANSKGASCFKEDPAAALDDASVARDLPTFSLQLRF